MLLHPLNGQVVVAAIVIAGILLSGHLVLQLRSRIIERRRADREREELAGRLIYAQEQERSRLAHELTETPQRRAALKAQINETDRNDTLAPADFNIDDQRCRFPDCII